MWFSISCVHVGVLLYGSNQTRDPTKAIVAREGRKRSIGFSPDQIKVFKDVFSCWPFDHASRSRRAKGTTTTAGGVFVVMFHRSHGRS